MELKIDTSVSRILSCVIFIFASLSDALDGYIARSRKLTTNLGKFLDPLVDKILICSILVALVEIREINGWIAIIILSREFSVTGLRIIAAEKNKIISANIMGKFKTLFQMLMCVALILNPILNKISQKYLIFTHTLIFISVTLTILSGYNYIKKNKNLFQE
jgi:CDP-diacylglycerol--glycerol-3-phosphate 3-phosphatidyltransferase